IDTNTSAPASENLPKLGETVYIEKLPQAITKVAPDYPELARAANAEGTVMVSALVGKDGRVKDVRVVKSIPMLDASALAAVKQWTFEPARAHQQPVAVWVSVPVRFTLK